jgi:3-oxoadipate enol-lactonase
MAELELTDRCLLHYRVDGSAEAGCPLLLFNGASLPLEFWGSVADRLAPERRVVRFDARNAGATQAHGAFTLLDVARDAVNLLDALGIERVVAVGHAWGGRVAQVFARDYPHRVAALVVCGTGGQFPPKVTADEIAAMRRAFTERRRDAWEAALESTYCAPGFRTRDPLVFGEIAELLWHAPAHPRPQWDPRPAPSESYWGMARAPTLLVYGQHDRNGTPENARDLAARIPGARLVTIEDAGHFVVREAEVRVAAEIGAFLSDISA